MGAAVVVGGLVVVEVEDVVLVVAVVEGDGATVVVAVVEVPGAGVVTGGNDRVVRLWQTGLELRGTLR